MQIQLVLCGIEIDRALHVWENIENIGPRLNQYNNIFFEIKIYTRSKLQVLNSDGTKVTWYDLSAIIDKLHCLEYILCGLKN